MAVGDRSDFQEALDREMGLPGASSPGDIVAFCNALRARVGDGLLEVPGVVKGVVAPEKYKCTNDTTFRARGATFYTTGTGEKDFSAAHVITADKYGLVLLMIDFNGAHSSKVVASPQAYNTGALALAAKPVPDAGLIEVGTVLIHAKPGADWTAIADDMTDGSDVATAVFADGPVSLLPAALA